MGYLYERVGTPANIGEQLFMTLLNVITNMLWGGTVKGQDRVTLGAEFRQVVVEMTELLGKPNLSDFYPWLAGLDLQGIEKKMKGFAKRLDRIFEMMIDERLEMKMDGHDEQIKDLLQALLQLKTEGDARNPLTMTHLKALLMDMVVGGTDTIATAIEMALAEMINKPEVMNKVQQEVDMVVGKDGIVEEYHLSKLPYLYAVLKEVLRLHPAVPLLVPHCPSKTCIVGGYTIPKGARVLINAWAIHRDPSIWVNPLEFIPERFMDSNYKLDFTGNDFRYLPFGSGRRICAGTAMAERMFLLSLAAVVHFFDWKLPEGEKLDLSEKFGIVLKKKIPLVVVPTSRLSNPAPYEALYE